MVAKELVRRKSDKTDAGKSVTGKQASQGMSRIFTSRSQAAT
jgi:hypothetical protein